MENTDMFEKYQKWFNTIEQMCNENNVGDSTGFHPYLRDYHHYVLENGLHVYKEFKGMSVLIADEEINELEETNYMEKNNSGVERIKLNVGMKGLEYLQETGPIIEYNSKEGMTFLPKDMMDFTSEKQQEMYKRVLPNRDFKELLSETIEQTGDERLKGIYTRALGLHEKIRDTVSLKEKESSINELETLSMGDLERMLTSVVEKNDSKKQELTDLRKRELIAKILEAQKEGKELDQEIAEVKAKNLENR